MKKYIVFLVVLFSVMWVGSIVNAAIIVGRISSVEGQIFRYTDVNDSWVATAMQSPAGIQDILATGEDSKAEIMFPNNQLVRLDESTEIEILNLEDEIGEFALHSGLARFYNNSSEGKLLIETARGTVTVEPGSAVDVLADMKSVTVSAGYGEALFYSYQDGVEKVEAISGSTRLEFREDSIIAGIGPIDRKWDRWCADREDVSARNSLVRSEHLPDSMQAYAYTMEPYGGWQRIYYRGYYYWAWRPHSVSAGWSPYTTGYWDDWQGSSVWVDYNPWGWATHHHGHWLNMQGAWLWTPYIHISNVSGVTAIGFNITFGKGYRSYWHPGRVRWIAYNDYIGWLPLAPRETYYGHRKWGPGSVVMHGGADLRINVNLSGHKHIDHAVIIPKHHLYDRKPGVMNNYNTVKIRNVNKTEIIKNYKQLAEVERLRQWEPSAKKSRNRNIGESIETRHGRNAVKAKETPGNENYEKKTARTNLAQRKVQEGRSVTGEYEKRSSRAIKNKQSPAVENKSVDVRDKAPRVKTTRSELSIHGSATAKREITTAKNSVAVKDTPGKSVPSKNISQTKGYKIRLDQAETIRKHNIKQESEIVAVQKNKVDAGRQTEKDSRPSQRMVERNGNSEKQVNKEKGKKYRGEEGVEKENSARQIAGVSQNSREKNALKEKQENKQKPGNGWYSASLNSRRTR